MDVDSVPLLRVDRQREDREGHGHPAGGAPPWGYLAWTGTHACSGNRIVHGREKATRAYGLRPELVHSHP